MTPLDKAQEILDGIVAQAAAMDTPVALPTPQYVRIGAPVVACPAVIIGFVSTLPVEEDLVPHDCGAVEQATFICTVALDCSAAFNSDGSDNVAKMAEVSERAQAVGAVLWTYANAFEPFITKTWSVTYGLAGGHALITLQLTTGVD